MRPINQAGPRLLGGVVPGIPGLSGDDLTAALDRGATIVDARAPEAHERDRIPGSLSIPAGSSFGTWLGWVLDADQPVVLLVTDIADLDDLARQALRIGVESIVGFIDGGLAAWRRSGQAVQAGATLDVDRLATLASAGGPDAPFVIDVRQATEYEASHVPGSVHIGAGDLPAILERLPRDRPIATICASGYRSSVGASMLRAAGFERVMSVSGGVPTWEEHGFPVESGGAPDESLVADGGTGPSEAHRHPS
jgi:hydroxyacylglutathione hydrolase